MRQGSQAVERDAPFQLRGATFTVMVLKIAAPDDPSFFPQLLNKIRQAPNFFRNAPVVLDLDEIAPGTGFDLVDFVVTLRSHNLIAVGVQGGSPEMQQLAVESGLPVMPSGRMAREIAEGSAAVGAGAGESRFGLAPGRAPTDPMPPKTTAASAAMSGAAMSGAAMSGAAMSGGAGAVPAMAAEARATMIVTEPVRSGRQVYAARGDLIVLGPVSPGAELLADGNIHVYGTLRGRALAGISGDKTARVFCQSLEAELVSIAGLYRIADDLDDSVFRKAVQVWLDDGYLRIDPLV